MAHGALHLSAVLPPGPVLGYVARNPETGTVVKGDTIEEALANLREVVELYPDECPIETCGPSLFTAIDLPRRA